MAAAYLGRHVLALPRDRVERPALRVLLLVEAAVVHHLLLLLLLLLLLGRRRRRLAAGAPKVCADIRARVLRLRLRRRRPAAREVERAQVVVERIGQLQRVARRPIPLLLLLLLLLLL